MAAVPGSSTVLARFVGVLVDVLHDKLVAEYEYSLEAHHTSHTEDVLINQLSEYVGALKAQRAPYCTALLQRYETELPAATISTLAEVGQELQSVAFVPKLYSVMPHLNPMAIHMLRARAASAGCRPSSIDVWVGETMRWWFPHVIRSYELDGVLPASCQPSGLSESV